MLAAIADVKGFLARIWNAVKTFVKEWSRDNAALMAAGVTFYAIFSLAPLLALIIVLGGAFFGADAARQQLVSSAGTFLSHGAAMAVGRLAENAAAARSPGLTVVSIVLLVWGASAVFRHLRAALDIVMDVPPQQQTSWIRFLFARLVAVVMVIGVIVFFAATIVAMSLLARARDILPHMPVADVAIWRTADVVVSTLLVTLLFTVTLKWVPEVDLKWRYPLLGAITGAALFTVARIGLAEYLRYGSLMQSYGGAASLAVALIATFLAVTTLFVAAEVTELLARHDEAFRRDREKRREARREPARK